MLRLCCEESNMGKTDAKYILQELLICIDKLSLRKLLKPLPKKKLVYPHHLITGFLLNLQRKKVLGLSKKKILVSLLVHLKLLKRDVGYTGEGHERKSVEEGTSSQSPCEKKEPLSEKEVALKNKLIDYMLAN
uniref:Uncharacterized protein n=2 Tax=Noccaea caerulescens TaxID=107243 RepID=A0A1J3FIP3_NOCCA